ncbi:hypothetical protein OUZ56_002395 [Daphnia magna]|uniref:Uncharacterized protein n=1 Tax=Daphnia magna TaxID=35525 RepID=A0ABR0A5T8_9CRUS|nr:hypothetical protein OUZ56_002395 [Daphnia magna]
MCSSASSVNKPSPPSPPSSSSSSVSSMASSVRRLRCLEPATHLVNGGMETLFFRRPLAGSVIHSRNCSVTAHGKPTSI